MPHQPGHTGPTRADQLRARQKIQLGVASTPQVGGKSIEEINLRSAFRRHQRAFSRRRTTFRETQGLFTTGLNLSRLRALSSIR
jgi:hypothetical protein